MTTYGRQYREFVKFKADQSDLPHIHAIVEHHLADPGALIGDMEGYEYVTYATPALSTGGGGTHGGVSASLDRRVLGFPHWADADKEQSWRDLGINKVDEPDILPLVLRTGCVAILFIVYYGEPGQSLMQNAAKLKVLAMLIVFYSLPW